LLNSVPTWKDNRVKSPFAHLSETEEQAVTRFVSAIKQKLGRQLIDIRLYGSKVRGGYSVDSDIDIMIVLKKRKEAMIDSLYRELLDVELEYDAKISLTVFSEAEYSRNVRAHTPFMLAVANEGVTLGALTKGGLT